MTLIKKKGIAVLKGVDVVHKLTQDGTANIGKTGSTVTLSGTIGVESAYGDMLSMFAGRIADIEWYGVTKPNDYFSYTAYDNTSLLAVASTQASSSIHLLKSDLATLETTTSTQESSATSINEAFHSTQTSDMDADEVEVNTLIQDTNTDISDREAQLSGMESTMVFLKDHASVDTITEVESLVLSTSGSNDTALVAQVGALLASLATETAARIAGDASVSANINQSGTLDRDTQKYSLLGLINAEALNRGNAYFIEDAAQEAARNSLLTLIGDEDDTLSALISSETSLRTAADASLAQRLADAVTDLGNVTGSFDISINAEEVAEEAQRVAKLADLNSADAEGDTITLRDSKTVSGSVKYEKEQRKVAYNTTFPNSVNASYIAANNAADIAHDLIDTDLTSEIADRGNQRTQLSSSINTELSVFGDAKISVLDAQIAAEEAAENADVIATEAVLTIEEGRMNDLQDDAVDTFSEVVSLLDSLSGSEASQLSSDVAAVVGNLATRTQDRITADNGSVGYLNNIVVANRTTDIAVMSIQISAAEATFLADENAHTATLATEKTALTSSLETWDAGTLATAEAAMTATRVAGDLALSGNIDTLVSDRQLAASNESTSRTDEDAILTGRLDAIEAHFQGDNMTLGGTLSVGGNLAVGGEVKLGVHTSVPAEYASGTQTGNNGAMFYLDAADDANRTDFEKGYSWYFCEDGVWFASPFDNE